MFDFYEKRKIRGLIFSKVSIGIILILTVFLSMSVFERYTVEQEMSRKRAVKESELSELKHRASTLEAQVQHLEDERGIEEELRSRFDVARKGEQVVILLDAPKEVGNIEDLTIPPGTAVQEGGKKSLFGVLKFW